MSLAVHGFRDSEPQARALAKALGAPFARVDTHRFPDGELLPTVPAPVETVVVCRSLDHPNDKLIELVLAAEAWRRLGARRLILVAPYLAYMRQDIAFAAGQAISQRAIAALIAERFDGLVTVDAHLHRTPSLDRVFPEGFGVNLSAGALIGRWFAGRGLGADALVVGPDVESTPLAAAAAEALGAPHLAFAKRRAGDREVALAAEALPALKGRKVLVIDDIVSTGATIAAVIAPLRAAGASDIRVAAVHALMDDLAAARLRAAGATQVVSTDSVTHPTNAIPLAGLLAEAVLHRETGEVVRRTGGGPATPASHTEST